MAGSYVFLWWCLMWCMDTVKSKNKQCALKWQYTLPIILIMALNKMLHGWGNAAATMQQFTTPKCTVCCKNMVLHVWHCWHYCMVFSMGCLVVGKNVACPLQVMLGMVGIGCMGSELHVFELCDSTCCWRLLASHTGYEGHVLACLFQACNNSLTGFDFHTMGLMQSVK